MQLTFKLHYRIHGFLLMELTAGKASQSHVFHEYCKSSKENADHFANISKVVLVPFAPS